MPDEVFEALSRLLSRTKENRVDWELLPDDEMIRTDFGAGLVRIGREEAPADDGRAPGGGLPYNVWVIDFRGRTRDCYVIAPSDAAYGTVEELFVLARRTARDSNEVMDEMIRALN